MKPTRNDKAAKPHKVRTPTVAEQRTYEARRAWLLREIQIYDGPANLAKKLRLTSPSYLSQLAARGRTISERTARRWEVLLGLPTGYIDKELADESLAIDRITGSLNNRIIEVMLGMLKEEGIDLGIRQWADIVEKMHEHANRHGIIDRWHLAKLIKEAHGRG